MLFCFVLVPVLIGVLLYLFPLGKMVALAAQAGLSLASYALFLNCREGTIREAIGGYGEHLGIILKADTLAAVFVMLTATLFLLAALYNYRSGGNRLFQFLFFVWEGLLMGLFLSNDLFNIFVLLEVATVVVSILIMFKREKRAMYDGMVYLMVNTAAIQFYLLGIGYIYKQSGVLDLDTAGQYLATLDKAALALPYALVMTCISLKCALMPLFSWLPKAHGTPGAPASVSALLSGLHIKCALYLFIRCSELFEPLELSAFFLYAGIITGIAGFLLALAQRDIKLILAYHTISQIGLMMIGLSRNDTYAYTGGIYHIINHAVFKAALFLCAGIIIRVYNTRDIYEIRGVWKRLPAVAWATAFAILGITGAPLFNGSISKYFIIRGADGLTEAAILLINLGTSISFIKYVSILFGAAPGPEFKLALSQKIAVLSLGILCLVGGIFGAECIEFLFGLPVRLDPASYAQKAIMYFVNVAAGYLLYTYVLKHNRLLKRIHEIEMGFKGICASVGVFFAVLLLVAGMA